MQTGDRRNVKFSPSVSQLVFLKIALSAREQGTPDLGTGFRSVLTVMSSAININHPIKTPFPFFVSSCLCGSCLSL